jgi:glutamyl-tRNA reductase
MQIIVVGLDHHTSPVEVRERLAFRPSQLATAFDRLLRGPDTRLAEAAILSTCNRVEIYGAAEDAVAARAYVVNFLHDFHGLPAGSVVDALYTHVDHGAVEHLFATACGLQSLVVGEPQIQAQVRAAAGDAAGHAALGPVLHALFRQAVEVGKRARTETGISRNAASISHAGVELARRLLGGLDKADVLLVGSGKVSELSAKNLVDNGARSITLVNRTVESAQRLAARWGGRALPFEMLPAALGEADVVISSTAAPHTVIHPEQVSAALSGRPSRPLLLIDLAVPRDVEAGVAEVEGAHVYDVDDLEQVVAGNIERRRAEFGAVERIVAEETNRFLHWLSARSVVPTLNRLREHADLIGRAELERALRRLPALGERDRAIVEALVAGVVNKILHQPTVRLKREAAEGDPEAYAAALQYLFGLDSGTHGS